MPPSLSRCGSLGKVAAGPHRQAGRIAAPGISEYRLIDPLRREATFYALGADGRYPLAPPDADGIYRSPALAGFPLTVAWLWQRPLPNPSIILRQLGR